MTWARSSPIGLLMFLLWVELRGVRSYRCAAWVGHAQGAAEGRPATQACPAHPSPGHPHSRPGQLARPTGENGNPTGGWPGGGDFQLGQGAHSPGQVVAQPPVHSLDPVPVLPGLVPSRAMHAPSSAFGLTLPRVGSASTWPDPQAAHGWGHTGGGEKPRRGLTPAWVVQG